jgi:hypothetical protein
MLFERACIQLSFTTLSGDDQQPKEQTELKDRKRCRTIPDVQVQTRLWVQLLQILDVYLTGVRNACRSLAPMPQLSCSDKEAVC